MAHAEKCPVCDGKGIVGEQVVYSTPLKGTTGAECPVSGRTAGTCHGCDGKGWVEVGERDQPRWRFDYTAPSWTVPIWDPRGW